MRKNFILDNEIKKELISLKNKIKKPVIIICGSANSGKSSIIKYLFKVEMEHETEQNILLKTEKFISEYITVHEIEEKNNLNNKNFLYNDNTVKFILKNSPKNDSEKIIVWYCISAEHDTISKYDIATVKELEKNHCKVAVLLTKTDQATDSVLEELMLKLKVKEITTIFKSTINENKDFSNNREFDKLIDWSQSRLDKYVQSGLYRALKADTIIKLNSKRKRIITKIVPTYSIAAAGVGATPIPFSDAALLIPGQICMCVHILKLYEIEELRDSVSSVVSSTIMTTIGRSLTGSLLKIIPGVGSLLGSTINAAVASSLTGALGYAITELGYRYSKSQINGKKNVLFEDIFTSKSIKRLMKEALKLHKERTIKKLSIKRFFKK